MPDSFPGTPPSDHGPRPNKKKPPARPIPDDDAIDFTHHSPFEDGASGALSFHVSRSGPLSGSTVLPWSELIRQADLRGEDRRTRRDDDDPASDADLLREVLAKEPPPSKVIKDPSAEMKALKDGAAPEEAESALGGLDDAPAALPTDISSPRLPETLRGRPAADEDPLQCGAPGQDAGSSRLPRAEPFSGRDLGDDIFHVGPSPAADDASSIFSTRGTAATPGEISGAGWDESSRVDLLSAAMDDADALQATNEVDLSAARNGDEDSSTSLGALAADPDADEGEASAVDLGSRPAVDVPFPLAVDSTVGSSMLKHRRDGRPASDKARKQSDSGTVDLLHASSDDFDLTSQGLSSGKFAPARQELPPTAVLPVVRSGRKLAWIGGGMAGLLTGSAVCLGLWYYGFLPDVGPGAMNKPLPGHAAHRASDQALAAWQAQRAELLSRADEATRTAQQAQSQHNSLLARLRRAQIDPSDPARSVARSGTEAGRKAQADLAEISAKLRTANIDPADLQAAIDQVVRAGEAAERAKKAQDALNSLTDALTRVNLNPADLATSLTKLSQARTNAEAAVVQAEARIAALRDDAAASAREAKAVEGRLKDELARTDAARKSLADFQTEVVTRLRAVQAVTPNAGAAEFLAALDSALLRVPGSLAQPNPAAAERQFGAGRDLFRAGNYYGAEQAFDAAIRLNDRDARYVYFRGLSRWLQGRTVDAAGDFARGAALERQNSPNPQDVDSALERVQGAPRQALNRFRP